jgi:hypothetical protein
MERHRRHLENESQVTKCEKKLNLNIWHRRSRRRLTAKTRLLGLRLRYHGTTWSIYAKFEDLNMTGRIKDCYDVDTDEHYGETYRRKPISLRQVTGKKSPLLEGEKCDKVCPGEGGE